MTGEFFIAFLEFRKHRVEGVTQLPQFVVALFFHTHGEIRFGADLLDTNRVLVDRLADEGRLVVAGRRLVPTVSGLAVADGLAAAFDLSLPN